MRTNQLSGRGVALLLLWSLATFAADPAPRHRTITDVKLLYFHASWCQSCKRLEAGHVLERLQESTPGLKVEQVDVDTQQSLLERYGVTVTPTLILLDREGFPLGIAVIDLDHPDVTLDRLQRLVKKMVKP